MPNLQRYEIEGQDGDRHLVGCSIPSLPVLRKYFAELCGAVMRQQMDKIVSLCDRILKINEIGDWVATEEISRYCLGEFPLLASINGISPVFVPCPKNTDTSVRKTSISSLVSEIPRFFWGCDRKRHFIEPCPVAKIFKVSQCFEDLQREIDIVRERKDFPAIASLYLYDRKIRTICHEILELSSIKIEWLDLSLLVDLVLVDGESPPVLARNLTSDRPSLFHAQRKSTIRPACIHPKNQIHSSIAVLVGNGVPFKEAREIVEEWDSEAIATFLRTINPKIAEEESHDYLLAEAERLL